MAKKQDKDLSLRLRGTGLRKKVARALTKSAGSGNSDKTPQVTRAVESLRAAAAELEDRVSGSRRNAAGKKAARTRKRKAAERSASARKAAKTRTKAH
jgi:hypothetical protein